MCLGREQNADFFLKPLFLLEYVMGGLICCPEWSLPERNSTFLMRQADSDRAALLCLSWALRGQPCALGLEVGQPL